MKSYIKDWDWNDLATHTVWLKLTFDPNQVRRKPYHAIVFDENGVTGSGDGGTAKEAAALAHWKQHQKRMTYLRQHYGLKW